VHDRTVRCHATAAAQCSYQHREVGVTLLVESVDVSAERSKDMVDRVVLEDLAVPALS